MAILSDGDQQFLKDLVDQPNSDYHDGLDGWDNYSIDGDVLTVTWTTGEEDEALRRKLTGRWLLTLIEGSNVAADEPEEKRDAHGFSDVNLDVIKARTAAMEIGPQD